MLKQIYVGPNKIMWVEEMFKDDPSGSSRCGLPMQSSTRLGQLTEKEMMRMMIMWMSFTDRMW